MHLTLGTIDLDALDVEELRAHRANLERGIRILTALELALDPEAAPLPAPNGNGHPAPQAALPAPAETPEPPPAAPGEEPEPVAEAEPEPEPEPEPPASPPPPRARHQRTSDAEPEHVEQAARFLEAVGDWTGTGPLRAELGWRGSRAADACRKLVAAGRAEHNGKGGAYSRYRATNASTTPPPAAEPPPPPAASPSAPARPAAPPLSPRVRKLEASGAPPIRERQAAALTDRQQRILNTLEGEQLTARQIAHALIANVHDVGADLRLLNARGLVQRDGDEWHT